MDARPPESASAFVLVALGLDPRNRRRMFALIATLARPPDGISQALRLAGRLIRLIFAPDVFLRQFTLAVVLHALLTIRRRVSSSLRLARWRYGHPADWQLLQDATSYGEWSRAALALDASSPVAVRWKTETRSPFYSHAKVLARTEDIARHVRNANVYELMYNLRSRQYRTQHNVGRGELYAHSLSGTKKVLEDYLESTRRALHYVKEMGLKGTPSSDGLVLSPRDVLAFINETRHAYGRTALHLSGGAALGVHHLGVLKAMMEIKLLPRVLSGTSAGSIIAAIAGVRTDLELERLLFSDHELADLVAHSTFFEPMAATPAQARLEEPRTVWSRLTRLLHSLFAPRGPVLNVETLGDTIRELVGDCTFLQAFNATGRILNIMVSRSDGREPMLLNYLTAPHVLVWSACRASSAVPGIFAPCELWACGPSGHAVALDELKFTDGCVDSDLPKARLTELFNVNNFVVSQVNPAASLFSTKAVAESGIASSGLSARLLRLLRAQSAGYIRTLNELSVGSLPFKTSFGRLFNLAVQEYDGDLNIYPDYPLRDLLHMIDNPTPAYLRAAVLRGQRAVWARSAQLQALCMLEFEMDAISHELQAHMQAVPAPLSASRRGSSDSVVATGVLAREPSVARGLKRVGQIPSFHTLDMNLGQMPPSQMLNPRADAAANRPLARSRYQSTPLGGGVLRSSSGSLSGSGEMAPPIASVASYLSLSQLTDNFMPRSNGGGEYYFAAAADNSARGGDDSADT
jgi:TAG lipase/steryl ester hydrolase/phospholipase A2/LPA acyltransferase